MTVSNLANDVLADEVMYYLEKYSSSVGGRELQLYWDNNDLYNVQKVLIDLRNDEFINEFQPNLEDYRIAHPKSPIVTGFNLDGSVPF